MQDNQQKKLTVLIISEVYHPSCGGVGWYSYYLAKGLAERGHKPIVITHNKNSKSESSVEAI